jgi:GLPGLI family protein
MGVDSVYIVAFYAEDIHVSSGPESFTGPPGMILKLSLPHEHVIW